MTEIKNKPYNYTQEELIQEAAKILDWMHANNIVPVKDLLFSDSKWAYQDFKPSDYLFDSTTIILEYYAINDKEKSEAISDDFVVKYFKNMNEKALNKSND